MDHLFTATFWPTGQRRKSARIARFLHSQIAVTWKLAIFGGMATWSFPAFSRKRQGDDSLIFCECLSKMIVFYGRHWNSLSGIGNGCRVFGFWLEVGLSMNCAAESNGNYLPFKWPATRDGLRPLSLVIAFGPPQRALLSIDEHWFNYPVGTIFMVSLIED